MNWITSNGWKEQNARGFTLIEVLMAMTIFAIGILALAGLQARYIGANAAARMQTEATALATRYLEWLQSLPYEHPELRPGGEYHDRSGAYRVSWSVRENEIPAGTKTIRIAVTPDNVRSRVMVRLSTMVGADT